MALKILILEDDKAFAEFFISQIKDRFPENQIDAEINGCILPIIKNNSDYDLIISDFSVLTSFEQEILKNKFINNLVFLSGHDPDKDLARKYIWFDKNNFDYVIEYISNRLLQLRSAA